MSACDHKTSEMCVRCYPWRDSTRTTAEVFHAEAHPGVFVPTLEGCEEHDLLEFLNRALNFEAIYPAPALPVGRADEERT